MNEEAVYVRQRGRMLFAVGLARLLPYGTLVRPRTLLYRLGGVRVGSDSSILGHLRVWGPAELRLGDRTTINGPCAISLDAPVILGDGVLVGHDVIITTGAHRVGPSSARGGRLDPASVHIGDGTWIGAGAIILPGVTIGPGSVVAAGAVVTKDVEADSLVAGIPARVVRQLPAAIED